MDSHGNKVQLTPEEVALLVAELTVTRQQAAQEKERADRAEQQVVQEKKRADRAEQQVEEIKEDTGLDNFLKRKFYKIRRIQGKSSSHLKGKEHAEAAVLDPASLDKVAAEKKAAEKKAAEKKAAEKKAELEKAITAAAAAAAGGPQTEKRSTRSQTALVAAAAAASAAQEAPPEPVEATLVPTPRLTLGLVPEALLPPTTKEVANSLKQKQQEGYLPYDNEDQISGFVQAVVTEATYWLGINQDLRIASQYYLSPDRPDVVLVLDRELGIPVGVIEVKLPDAKPEITTTINSPKFHGQLMDYLLALRHLYGVRHPFGIASTYQHWRFCWLPDSDHVAAETPQSKIPTTFVTLPRPPPRFDASQLPLYPVEHVALSTSEENANTALVAQARVDLDMIKSKKVPERILHGTNVFSIHDDKFALHLVSVLHKMASAELDLPPLEAGRLYPLATETQWNWDYLPMLPKEPPMFPYHGQTHYFLVSELGSGAEARVYRGCTFAGDSCVIKIFKDPAAVNGMKEELEAWKTVWGVKHAMETTIFDRPALVMPLVYIPPPPTPAEEEEGNPIPASISGQRALLDAARAALRHLDSLGHSHDDLHWRHVGFFKTKDGAIKAVLIDLKKVHKTDNSLAEMMAKLGL